MKKFIYNFTASIDELAALQSVHGKNIWTHFIQFFETANLAKKEAEASPGEISKMELFENG